MVNLSSPSSGLSIFSFCYCHEFQFFFLLFVQVDSSMELLVTTPVTKRRVLQFTPIRPSKVLLVTDEVKF